MAAPVVIETYTNAIPSPVNRSKVNVNSDYDSYNNKGFPFDDSDRDRSFRSHIDDIINRHPELAEHLKFDKDFDSFPFRSNSWRRRGSNDRFHQQPFRFRDEFDFAPTGQPQDSRQENPPEKAPAHEQKQEENSSEKPPQVPNGDRGRKVNPNVPQSHTVDLGQKQEPVYESRNQQRSMSAPPENRAGQQRFVSSINIPIQSDHQQQSAPPQQPPPLPQQQQPQQPAQQQSKGERVIPIHVEGRDEPVIPKHSHQSYSQPQPERVFTPPQTERVFGSRPNFAGHWDRPHPNYYSGDFFHNDPEFFPDETHYDGGPRFFKNRGESPQRRADFGSTFKAPPHFQQQPQTAAPPPPQQKAAPPPPQQKAAPPPPQQKAAPPPPQQKAATPPPQATAPPKTPIEHIQSIQRDVLQLMDQVEQFNGKPRDKHYLYLDEMLTRNLLKLDNIDTEGKDNIRQTRKEAINCIQKCISILEAKAVANELLRKQLMGAASPPAEALELGDVIEEEKAEESLMETETAEAPTEPEKKTEDAAAKEEEAAPAEAAVQEVAPEEEQMETTPEAAVENASQPEEGKTDSKKVKKVKKKEKAEKSDKK